ncbi:MAG TPA: SDR family NAD(P)-dependent oxidoreductase [Polyangiaceae bacterium]|nr:SDR family NAD(P)-dependent oxidoreductase [Polyangiaceae bacterium]
MVDARLRNKRDGSVSSRTTGKRLDFELAGKGAIVTGGSRGTGKAIARVLAAEGVDVAISARGEQQLKASAQELASATGRRIVPIAADTGKEADANRLVETAIAELGGVDILVNNAALPGGISTAVRLEQIIDAQVLEDINIKVVGYLRTARALALAPHPGATRTERADAAAEKLAKNVSIGGIVDAKRSRGWWHFWPRPGAFPSTAMRFRPRRQPRHHQLLNERHDPNPHHHR